MVLSSVRTSTELKVVESKSQIFIRKIVQELIPLNEDDFLFSAHDIPLSSRPLCAYENKYIQGVAPTNRQSFQTLSRESLVRVLQTVYINNFNSNS